MLNYYEELGVFLYLTPILSSFCFACALLLNKCRTHAQKILGIGFIVLGAGMSFSFGYDRYNASYPNEILRPINIVMTAMCVIAVWFYFVTLMQPKKLTRRYVLTIIYLVIGCAALICGADTILNGRELSRGWSGISANIDSPAVILRLVSGIIVVALEIWIFRKVMIMYMKHRKFILDKYSYSEDIDLNWILFSIVLFSAFALIDLLWIVNTDIDTRIVFHIIPMTVIPIIFYLGFTQGETPTEDGYVSTSTEIDSNCTDTIAFKPLSRQDEISTMLLEYFKEKKPYLNPELSLRDVAESVGTNITYLSQVINRDYGMNFYTFVNNYRVEHAISIIENHNGRLIGEQLCMDSGFKSRSVFYKHFKEKTGCSPQEYITLKKDIVN